MVDSIVRQSRHQFGVDKDVFGPRFLKNFTDTFQNLYCCPEDDKVLHVCGFGIAYIIRMNDEKKYLNGGMTFFFFRVKLYVFWTCGRKMVCLTWTSSSLWWIWQMEPWSLPLHCKVINVILSELCLNVCNNAFDCYLRVKERELMIYQKYVELHAIKLCRCWMLFLFVNSCHWVPARDSASCL